MHSHTGIEGSDHTTSVVMVSIASALCLAIAMGVGRFAFTPIFPLMVRDGLISNDLGSLIAASNYLGYLVGALVASRLRFRPAALIAMGLLVTLLVTATFGWTQTPAGWFLLRFVAGVMSAWTLVGTSAWGLGWLSNLGRPDLAGVVFSGVGLGIAAAGVFCLLLSGPDMPALEMWIQLGALSAIVSVAPIWVLSKMGAAPTSNAGNVSAQTAGSDARHTTGLVICYSLFGFGYILPATYLPALAQQLINDPKVFGLAWPIFGMAAAISTIAVASGLKKVNRLKVWTAGHLLMATGVMLPCVWSSILSVCIAALLVGGTFMVITMIGMQEARNRASSNPTALLGKMTAGFGLGQLLGPIVSAVISRLTPSFDTALNIALSLAAAGLVLSALYLSRVTRQSAT